MRQFFKFISNFLFFSGLIIAGLFLVGKLTGKTPISAYIVSSGSMEPAIRTGSVVVVSPRSSYEVTDIITFYSGRDNKTTTTHRIVAADGNNFRVYGDANDQPDPVLVPKEKVIGSVRFSIPFLGYLAAKAKTPGGFILLVIVPATIIIYEELKSLFLEIKKLFKKIKILPSPELRRGVGGEVYNNKNINFVEGNERGETTRAWFAKPAIILPIFFALLIPLTLSISYFIDRETSSGNMFIGTTPEPEEGATIQSVEQDSEKIPADLSVQQLIGSTPTPTPDPTKTNNEIEIGSNLELEPTPTQTPQSFSDVGPLPTPTPTPDPNLISTPAPTPDLTF